MTYKNASTDESADDHPNFATSIWSMPLLLPREILFDLTHDSINVQTQVDPSGVYFLACQTVYPSISTSAGTMTWVVHMRYRETYHQQLLRNGLTGHTGTFDISLSGFVISPIPAHSVQESLREDNLYVTARLLGQAVVEARRSEWEKVTDGEVDFFAIEIVRTA